MTTPSNARKCLAVILWLVAFHSLIVTFGILLTPASAMPAFGFTAYVEPFFPAQGAVFHLVMAVAYALAAVGIERFRGLILVAILAKLMATVFLLTYYFFCARAWAVLVSAIGDGLMGTAILALFLAYRRAKPRV